MCQKWTVTAQLASGHNENQEGISNISMPTATTSTLSEQWISMSQSLSYRSCCNVVSVYQQQCEHCGHILHKLWHGRNVGFPKHCRHSHKENSINTNFQGLNRFNTNSRAFSSGFYISRLLLFESILVGFQSSGKSQNLGGLCRVSRQQTNIGMDGKKASFSKKRK